MSLNVFLLHRKKPYAYNPVFSSFCIKERIIRPHGHICQAICGLFMGLQRAEKARCTPFAGTAPSNDASSFFRRPAMAQPKYCVYPDAADCMDARSACSALHAYFHCTDSRSKALPQSVPPADRERKKCAALQPCRLKKKNL